MWLRCFVGCLLLHSLSANCQPQSKESGRRRRWSELRRGRGRSTHGAAAWRTADLKRDSREGVDSARPVKRANTQRKARGEHGKSGSLGSATASSIATNSRVAVELEQALTSADLCGLRVWRLSCARSPSACLSPPLFRHAPPLLRLRALPDASHGAIFAAVGRIGIPSAQHCPADPHAGHGSKAGRSENTSARIRCEPCVKRTCLEQSRDPDTADRVCFVCDTVSRVPSLQHSGVASSSASVGSSRRCGCLSSSFAAAVSAPLVAQQPRPCSDSRRRLHLFFFFCWHPCSCDRALHAHAIRVWTQHGPAPPTAQCDARARVTAGSRPASVASFDRRPELPSRGPAAAAAGGRLRPATQRTRRHGRTARDRQRGAERLPGPRVLDHRSQRGREPPRILRPGPGPSARGVHGSHGRRPGRLPRIALCAHEQQATNGATSRIGQARDGQRKQKQQPAVKQRRREEVTETPNLT